MPSELDSVIIDEHVTLPDGSKYDIPREGSLGLLALGYKGLLLWRKRRKEAHSIPASGFKDKDSSQDNTIKDVS